MPAIEKSRSFAENLTSYDIALKGVKSGIGDFTKHVQDCTDLTDEQKLLLKFLNKVKPILNHMQQGIQNGKGALIELEKEVSKDWMTKNMQTISVHLAANVPAAPAQLIVNKVRDEASYIVTEGEKKLRVGGVSGTSIMIRVLKQCMKQAVIDLENLNCYNVITKYRNLPLAIEELNVYGDAVKKKIEKRKTAANDIKDTELTTDLQVEELSVMDKIKEGFEKVGDTLNVKKQLKKQKESRNEKHLAELEAKLQTYESIKERTANGNTAAVDIEIETLKQKQNKYKSDKQKLDERMEVVKGDADEKEKENMKKDKAEKWRLEEEGYVTYIMRPENYRLFIDPKRNGNKLHPYNEKKFNKFLESKEFAKMKLNMVGKNGQKIALNKKLTVDQLKVEKVPLAGLNVPVWKIITDSKPKGEETTKIRKALKKAGLKMLKPGEKKAELKAALEQEIKEDSVSVE